MPKESQYGGCIKMMLLGKILVCFSKLILNTRCYQRLIKEKLRVKWIAVFEFLENKGSPSRYIPHLEHKTQRGLQTQKLSSPCPPSNLPTPPPPVTSQICAEALRMLDPGQSREALRPDLDALVSLRCRKQPGWTWASELRVPSVICCSSLLRSEVRQSQTVR